MRMIWIGGMKNGKNNMERIKKSYKISQVTKEKKLVDLL